MSEYRLRQEIIRVTRIVASQGLVRSSDGNISVRLPAEELDMLAKIGATATAPRQGDY